MKSYILSLVIFLASCNFVEKYYQAPEQVSKPIVVALGIDQSKSISLVHNNIPTFSVETLDSLFSALRAGSGNGELGFAPINHKKPVLHRLRLDNPNLDKTLLYNAIRQKSAPHTRLYETLEFLIAYLEEPHHYLGSQVRPLYPGVLYQRAPRRVKKGSLHRAKYRPVAKLTCRS